MRLKGELSPAGIDRDWPHQEVRRGTCEYGGYKEIHDFWALNWLMRVGIAGIAGMAA